MKSRKIPETKSWCRTLPAGLLVLFMAGAQALAADAAPNVDPQAQTVEREPVVPPAPYHRQIVPGPVGVQQAQGLIGEPLITDDGEVLGVVERVVRDQQGVLGLVVPDEHSGKRRVVDAQHIELRQQGVLPEHRLELVELDEYDEAAYETVATGDDPLVQEPLPGAGRHTR